MKAKIILIRAKEPQGHQSARKVAWVLIHKSRKAGELDGGRAKKHIAAMVARMARVCELDFDQPALISELETRLAWPEDAWEVDKKAMEKYLEALIEGKIR